MTVLLVARGYYTCKVGITGQAVKMSWFLQTLGLPVAFHSIFIILNKSLRICSVLLMLFIFYSHIRSNLKHLLSVRSLVIWSASLWHNSFYPFCLLSRLQSGKKKSNLGWIWEINKIEINKRAADKLKAKPSV